MLPEQVQDHERVRAQLNAALNAMNSSVEGTPLPAAYTAYAAPPAVGVSAAPAGLAGSRWAGEWGGCVACVDDRCPTVLQRLSLKVWASLPCGLSTVSQLD